MTLKATLSRKGEQGQNRRFRRDMLVHYILCTPGPAKPGIHYQEERAWPPSYITKGESDLKCVGPFTWCDFCRCRGFSFVNIIFSPFPAHGICSGARIPVLAVRRAIYYAGVGAWSHSRTVDEAFRTTEDEEIVEKGRDEAAAARTNDRTPDPIMVTKCEHCQGDRVLAHCKRGRPRSGQGMYGPCAPYPTIAVMMRGPRSRAGLTA